MVVHDIPRYTLLQSVRHDGGTGRVSVLPEGAEARVAIGYEYRTSAWGELPERLERYISSRDLRGGFFGVVGQGHVLRFRERVIETGGRTVVHGIARDPTHRDANAEEGGRIVIARGHSGQPFTIADGGNPG